MPAIKLIFGDVIRRFSSDHVDYPMLERMVKTFFPQLTNVEFSFVWIDEEGEFITISASQDAALQEAELHEAIHVMSAMQTQAQSNILRFSIVPNAELNAKTAAAAAKVAEQEQEGVGATHFHVQCDGCGIKPIVGARYKCTVRNDFDLCEKCEATKPQPFPMMKIAVPRSAHSGRCPRSFDRGCGMRRGPPCLIHKFFDIAQRSPCDAKPNSCRGGEQGESQDPNNNNPLAQVLKSVLSSLSGNQGQDQDGPSYHELNLDDILSSVFGEKRATTTETAPPSATPAANSGPQDPAAATATPPDTATDSQIEAQLMEQAMRESLNDASTSNPVEGAASGAADRDLELRTLSMLWRKELDILANMGFYDVEILTPLLQTHLNCPVSMSSDPNAAPRIEGLQIIIGALLKSGLNGV